MAYFCKNCEKKLSKETKSGLCQSCLKQQQDEEKIKHWLETGDTGCKVATTLRNVIRDYIKESQNHKCAICGMEDTWNGKELHFVLDHIDGDASNNSESNLQVLCPNCHAMTDSYMDLNKGKSARDKRYN